MNWFLLGKTVVNVLLVPVAVVRDGAQEFFGDADVPLENYTARQVGRIERDAIKLLDELLP
jgi:hypothetical protein